MRSRVKAIALVVLIGPLSAAASATEAVKSAPPTNTAPSTAAIDAAIADLRNDPNLGGQTKIRTLRWSSSSRPRPPPSPDGWLFGLFEYLGRFGGLLLWAAGAGAAAMAAIWILRLLKTHEPREGPAQPGAVVRQVGDLDIRPESLPDDVGGAALELLRTGRVRESLSLLYRASLSSAVHRFGVSIAAHHTEREVLGAVRGALDEPRTRYFVDLVTIRQRIVYAGESLAPDAVLPLCAGFSTLFNLPPP